MRGTPDDPAEPVLPSSARILGIDRIRAPYSPSNIRYIAEFVPWSTFEELLVSKGF